ncbi:MAG: HNH endonuclease [Acidimicrobiia bacterium]
MRLQVLDRDQWRCVPEHAGCEFKAPFSLKLAGKFQAHCHHRIDRLDGGADRLENLVSCCRLFNLGESQRRRAVRARRQRAVEQGQPAPAAVTLNGGRKVFTPYSASLANGASRDW